MTLPTSGCATRISMTLVERSRSTSRTSTDSPSRTRCLTISSTASLIISESGRGLGRLRLRLLADELADGVGRLRAALYPVVDALHVEAHLGRVAGRVVEADVLDVGAVALRQLLLDDNAVRRALLRAHAHQSDC